MTPTTVLRKARKKLSKPSAWCQKAWAKRADGVHILPSARGACAWCVIGVINEVGDYGVATCGALRTLEEAIGTEDAAEWNDAPGRTHAEVMAAFDRAIELAEEQ